MYVETHSVLTSCWPVCFSYDDWIEDVEPGDVADHPLLPIVYP